MSLFNRLVLYILLDFILLYFEKNFCYIYSLVLERAFSLYLSFTLKCNLDPFKQMKRIL